MAVLLVLAGCSDSADRLNTTLRSFAEALSSGDAAAAAALTTDEPAAADTLGALFASLGNDVRVDAGTAEEQDGAATFTLDTTWKFGPDGRNEWTYSTTGAATADGDDWRIRWNPTTVAPGLDQGPLSYSTLVPQPAARVLDRTGAELLTQHIVTLVDITAGVDVNAVAALLNPIAPGITPESLARDLDAAAGKPVTAVILRQEDLAPIESQLTGLPNVTLNQQLRLLATDRALTSPTLSGLSDLWQQRTDAAAGWAVSAETSAGAQRVGGQDARPVGDIASTLDIGLQRAAEDALAPLTTPAAIVAIQPSTGDLLAVAQNAPADAQGPIALTGLYPPGSTFKTVTVSAALQSGQVTPDSVVACPGTENIEGRQIPNDDNFDLGEVPLHTAFAKSCNTTMGRLAVNLPPDGLTRGRRATRPRDRLHRAGHDDGHRIGAGRRHPRAAGRGRHRPGEGDRLTVRHGAGRRDTGARIGSRTGDRRGRSRRGRPHAGATSSHRGRAGAGDDAGDDHRRDRDPTAGHPGAAREDRHR